MSSGSTRVSGELVRAYGVAHDDGECAILAHGLRAQVLMQQVAELAASDRSVLICGETGTGKTVIARALHAQSVRSPTPLRVINCAALSDALLANAMAEFEHDASHAGPGNVHSTILLDEIGELSPWGQAVLLRKLQQDARAPRVRFIAATHRDLDLMITQGSFSRELVWRLNMGRITLAPLRDRRDEVVPLALHFLRLGLQHATSRFVSIMPELSEVLERYDWPGNVRELKNAMLRTLAVNESGALGPEDLPDAVRSGPPRSARSVR
ncbi:MAG: Response regulator of zinc sigma-54-dependent two-component system [Myxococcaceae bacterium]|nr:Response regulator of zinc sigma-54-dependent two-component system [Myxococcaceae bacterium]